MSTSLFRYTLSLIVALLILTGCGTRDPNAPILDLAELEQDAGAYHGLPETTPLISPKEQQRAFASFLEAHFSPWERTTPEHTSAEMFWGLASYGNAALFGENTLLRDPSWMRHMAEASQVEEYPSMGRRAISVTNTSMRVLPTRQPAFLDFKKAGEGFPFDYMQNSLVLAGTPLYAAHTSKDGAWILVESRFAFGWVPLRDIAWVDDAFATAYRTGTYSTPVKDDVPATDDKGFYCITARIGSLIPVSDENTFILPGRDHTGKAVIIDTSFPAGSTEPAPIPATPANFTRLANTMLGEQYGWGGLYENRDCSATTMDLMAAFGIFLPRNSSQQIKLGTPVDLQGLDTEDKKEHILETATPFLTLVRKPGHIMLYIGSRDDDPIVLHSIWGVKTLDGDGYGRKIIGVTAITTLEPGRERDDLAGTLLESVSRISTLP